MTSYKCEDFIIPFPICHTEMSVLFRLSCLVPSPYCVALSMKSTSAVLNIFFHLHSGHPIYSFSNCYSFESKDFGQFANFYNGDFFNTFKLLVMDEEFHSYDTLPRFYLRLMEEKLEVIFLLFSAIFPNFGSLYFQINK